MKRSIKKYVSMLLALILIFSFVSCGSESEEKKNEKYDVNLLDTVETNAMALWIKGQEQYPDLCEKLASEGLYYDVENSTFTDVMPEEGYGKGTDKDGGQSWTYYAGVADGKPVTKQYDSTKDYTNCCIKAFYDKEIDLYYYDWVEIE